MYFLGFFIVIVLIVVAIKKIWKWKNYDK
jgi:hypothetical protein